MEFYKYLLILIVITILLLKGMYNTKFSPEKIKKIALITVIAMLLRYITLIILFIINNIKYLYMLKFLFFMNFLAVPIIGIFTLYIFMRSNNFNFSYTFIVSIIFLLIYCVTIYKFPINIESMGKYGYTMFFQNHIFIYWVYILINTFMLFVAGAVICKKGVNKIGIGLIIISSFVTVGELILWIIGIKVLPDLVIGDMLWVVTAVYALRKVKKNK